MFPPGPSRTAASPHSRRERVSQRTAGRRSAHSDRRERGRAIRGLWAREGPRPVSCRQVGEAIRRRRRGILDTTGGQWHHRDNAETGVRRGGAAGAQAGRQPGRAMVGAAAEPAAGAHGAPAYERLRGSRLNRNAVRDPQPGHTDQEQEPQIYEPSCHALRTTEQGRWRFHRAGAKNRGRASVGSAHDHCPRARRKRLY